MKMSYSQTVQEYQILYENEPVLSLVNTYVMLQRNGTTEQDVIMQAILKCLKATPKDELVSVKDELKNGPERELLEKIISTNKPKSKRATVSV